MKNKNNPKNVKLVFFGNGSKILDSKFKSDIIFDYDIDLLDEDNTDIFLSGLNIENSEKEFLTNKVNLKNTKKGLFEKFFNLFG